jgi:hypothetical protein
MINKLVTIAAGVVFSLSAGQLMAAKAVESTTVTCADLNWSAEVLTNNPDIAAMCQTVYEKDGELYAKVSIEVTRIRGNKMTFRPIGTDGMKGESRRVTLGSDWRANIAGREYRLGDLIAGQQLNVYLPEGRFALSIGDDDAHISELVDIEPAEEPAAMPTTASPLFLFGLAGAGFLALGSLLSVFRRRLA